MAACRDPMNTADVAAGCIALFLIVIPWAMAANRLAGRLLPAWNAAAGVLVTAVIGVSGVLVAAELLGVMGGFARWPLAALLSVVSLVVLTTVAPRTPVPSVERRPGPDRAGWAALGLALVAALAVSAALLGRDARVLTTGPTDADALHYHLSESAWFVQTHSINHLHQTASSDASVYYPLDVELLDAVAMLGPRPDIATLGLNVGFGWLALLACWVIGARWQMGPAAVAAGAAVLAVPLIAGAASGPGLNDIPAIASLLAAVALLVHAEGRSRWPTAIAVAGLALGLAAGTKLTLLAVVVLVAVTAVWCAPGRRWLTAGLVSSSAVLTGGFWFGRDWVSVGSPVPSVGLTIAGHGFHQVPYPQVKPDSFSVAHYLGDGSVIRHWFVPSLKIVATPAWPLVLGLPVLGLLAALLLRGERIRRLLAVVGLVGIAAYLVTPMTALGPAGRPILFGANLRYVAPVLALGLVLLVTAAPLRRLAVPVTLLLTGFTLALLTSSTTGLYVDRPRGWALALLVAVAVGWFVVVSRQSPVRLVTAAVAVLSLLVVANAAAVLQHHYLTDRYAAPGPRNRLFAAAAGLHHQRIGVVGLPLQYPFTGPRLDNSVSYVGVEAPDHSFAAPTTCSAWRVALATGRYDYVVIEPRAAEHTEQLLVWTASIPGARLVDVSTAGSVISLPPTVGTAGCGGATAG